MIGQVVRHGRTTRDSKNLEAHLLKDAGARIEILNSVAPDLYAAMSDMQLARDGSRAESAFLHLSISPARNMNDDELRHVANIVIRHFGADDHQAVFVIHDKDRSTNKGNSHGHIVLGRVGPDGHVISSGFEKIRLETAMRIAEFELGEIATLGRHHGSTLKWLRNNGRDDVADYMVLAHSEKPEKPMSSASPAIRQKIERTTGKDLNSISCAVRDAWEKSDNGQSFAAALSDAGLSLKTGKKDGVFVVLHNGHEVAALDRLLKEKRNIVKLKMGDFQDDNSTKDNDNSVSSDERYLQGKPSEQKRSRKIDTIAEPFRDTRAAAGRAYRIDTAIARSDFVGAKASHDRYRRSRKEGRQIDRKTSLISLDKIRLSNNTVIAAQCIKTHKIRKDISNFEFQSAFQLIENRTSGWEFIRFLKDDLMCKIKEVHEKYFKRPEPVKGVFIKKNAEKSIYKNHEKYLGDEPANMKFG